MTVRIHEDEQYYICHDGRELHHIRTETREKDGYTQTFEVYGCTDCSGCEHKARCLYKYNAEKSHANIQSDNGILKRQDPFHPDRGAFRRYQ